MKKNNKILTRIDKAFSEALEMVGKKKGKSKKNVCIRIRFLGEQKALELGMFNLKTIVRLNHWELYSPKLAAIRFSLEDLYCSFQAFYTIVKEQFKVESDEDIALLLYESAKAQRPILVGCIDGKMKNCMYVSDLVAILGIGDDQLN